MLDHPGHIITDYSGEHMIGYFNDGGFNSPQIGQSLGHFEPYGPGADDDGLSDFPLCHILFNGNGFFHARNRKHARQVRAGDRQAPCPAPGGQDKLVIGKRLFFPAHDILYLNRLCLPVNGDRLCAGHDLHIFYILKKFFIPDHMKACFLKLFRFIDIP